MVFSFIWHGGPEGFWINQKGAFGYKRLRTPDFNYTETGDTLVVSNSKSVSTLARPTSVFAVSVCDRSINRRPALMSHRTSLNRHIKKDGFVSLSCESSLNLTWFKSWLHPTGKERCCERGVSIARWSNVMWCWKCFWLKQNDRTCCENSLNASANTCRDLGFSKTQGSRSCSGSIYMMIHSCQLCIAL